MINAEPITDIDDVDFEKLIEDLKNSDYSELVKSAKEMLGGNNHEAMYPSIIKGLIWAFVSVQSGCIDAAKVIAVLNEVDPTIIKNLTFKITGDIIGQL